MISLAVWHSAWLLMFYCLCGNVAAFLSADSLSMDFGRCGLTFSARDLLKFKECLCTGAQICRKTPTYSSRQSEDKALPTNSFGEMSHKRDSTPIHYVCDGKCRRKLFYYELDSFACSRVQLEDNKIQCKKGIPCDRGIRFHSSKSTHCSRCIDIRWEHSEEIKVSIRYDLLQYGYCPSERWTTTGTTSVQTSPNLSLMSSDGSTTLSNEITLKPMFLNGSSILSNETTLSPMFPITTLTGEIREESVGDSSEHLLRIIVPFALSTAVIVAAVTSVCIISRRRSRKASIQRSRHIYITPVDITYSSTEFLPQRYTDCNPLAPNGYLQLSNSRMCLAMENEYSYVSYPESCNQIPVNQTSRRQTDACCLRPSVNEYAEVTNIYIDLAKTAMTNEASNRTQYANVTGLDPNDSSNAEVTKDVCGKVSELSEKAANKSSYSKINTSSKRIDGNAGKHSSSTSKNPSFVCNDGEGPYTIMKPTTSNVNENKKKIHNSSIIGTQLGNKDMMYTRLRENNDPVSNVYDDLVTESDDRTFKSDFLYSIMDTEDENTLDLCPLNKKECTEEDRLNGNVYANNDISELDTEGYCINNAFISNGEAFSSAYSNSVMNEDKITKRDSPYVNYTDQGNELAESLPTSFMSETSAGTHLPGTGYSTVVVRNKRNDHSPSGNDDKENNTYVEMLHHDSSPS